MRKVITILIMASIVICMGNTIQTEAEENIPGIPELKIFWSSCSHFVKLQVGMTGKVNEVIIERKANAEDNFKEILSVNSDELREFMGIKFYDENVMPGKKYFYRVHSKLENRISPSSEEYEFDVPKPRDWFYPSKEVKIVSFSEMPKIEIEPYQVDVFGEKVIVARLLPEEIAGKNIVYSKYLSKYSKEYAKYGIFEISEKDKKASFKVLWKDDMREDMDSDWEYTGRFFLCDVTGDGKKELGLVLISGNGNLQRVYFFNSGENFECVFKNKFNINCYKDEGDDTYKIKPPYIITYGIRRNPNDKKDGKYWFGPFFRCKKVYKYDPRINRFLLVHAREELVNNECEG